jgi:hypothetical protein
MLEPAAVLGEVRADRADQQRPLAQAAQPEGDVGGDATAADVQGVHQERQRDLVQLVRHELLDEPAREGHQVVGRDRSGHGNAHG